MTIMECLNYPYVNDSILKYNVLSDGTCSVIDLVGNDSITDFLFPSEIDSMPVVHIANAALSALPNVCKIRIPASVELLGDYIGDPEDRKVSAPVFSELLESIVVDKKNKFYCSVKGILYSKNMEVLYYCPRYNEWRGAKVGGKTKIIKTRAFAGCHYLETASVLADVIESEAFEGCIRLKEALCDVSTIEDKAFASCDGLKEVILGNQLEYVGDYAFANCYSLKAVYSDTDKLARMNTSCFEHCRSLNTISIPDGSDFISIENVVFRKSNADNKYIVSDIPEGMYNLVLFPSSRRSTEYVAPLNIYSIEDGAFMDLVYPLKLSMPFKCIVDFDKQDSLEYLKVDYLEDELSVYPNWKIC